MMKTLAKINVNLKVFIAVVLTVLVSIVHRDLVCFAMTAALARNT